MNDLEFLRQLPYRRTLYMAVAWLSLTRRATIFKAVTVVGKAVPEYPEELLPGVIGTDYEARAGFKGPL